MKRKLLKMLKSTLCYVLALGMISGSLFPMQVRAASDATLIAHYDFEAAEGTTVPNKVGDDYTGTLSGAAVISNEDGTNVLGNSLKFGSTVGGMQLTDILNACTTSFTVSMWYKLESTSSTNVNLVQAGEIGGSTGRTILILDPNAKYYTYITGDNAKRATTAQIDPTKWQHITFSYDKDNNKAYFYVNGTVDSAEGVTLSGTPHDIDDLIIGRHRTDTSSFSGLVDEVRIYRGVVSAEEAKEIYDEKAELVNTKEPEPEPGEISSVVLTVNPNSVERVVDDSIFGINHRYAFNGYGTFDSYLMEMKDDFQKLYEEAGFGSIRYPGGTISNLFNWKTTLDSVGRKNQIHGFYNNAGQGGIEPNFGIKEIADFADEVDSEIVYVYSLGRGSAQDAEDLIEFLNAEVGTNPNGGIDWAEVRSENGHPKPYNVRYFEIGNEMNQVMSDGTTSQGYWLHGVSNAETGYIVGGTATFTNQYAVCEEDWNAQASKSDGTAGMVRYMRYANTNPKKYDESGKIVDDETFTAVNKGSVSVNVGGTAWAIVENFDNSSADDKHVVVDYSTGALIFGDGEKGAIPAAGQQINVSYSVERDGFAAISRAMKETTEKINKANEENGVDVQHEALVYSGYESQGVMDKLDTLENGTYRDLYDGMTIHPYSGSPSGSGAAFYDSAMSLAESNGVGKVTHYNFSEGKVPVISEYGIFRSTDSLLRSQTHAVYIAKVIMEYVRLGSPYIQKHCLTDWYSSGADSLGPTQQAVIQVVAQNGANTKTGEGDFAFFSTPSARVFQMLNSSFGTDILESSFNTQEKLSNGVKAYSALASKDAYDNYYAAFVNIDRENAKNLEVKVEGVDFTGKDVEVQMLSSDSFSDENTLENPDNVVVETTTFVAEGSTVTVEVPKHSFAVIKVSAGVDKTALEAAIDDAKDLAEDEYTKESWTAANVADAIAAAEAVLNDEAATKEAVTAAEAALAEAVEKLERVSADKADLEAKIAEADELVSTNYTGDTWEALQIILSAAKNVAAKENAAQDIVDKVLADLTDAMEALKEVIPVSEMTAISGSQYLPGTANEGPDDFILDGDSSTHWHTNWATSEGSSVENRWIGVSLNEATEIDGIQYLPRNNGGNGAVTEYIAQYRETDDGEWIDLATGTWNANDKSWMTISFDKVTAKQVRVVGVHTYADSGNDAHMSTAEFRLLKAAEEIITPEPPVEEEDEVVRLYGDSRYDTGYAVADALKEVLGVDKFEAVVVATGKNFADALAGSYLAVEKNAPILLTNGKADNIAELHAYIAANVAEGGKVYILGGEGAVPAAVDAIDGYDVVRLFGDSRYDTNLAILEEAGVTGDSIIVATGKNFADSLSASAAKLPILLVKPNAALNDAQKEVLAGMKNIYIVGGEGAVSSAYEVELAAYGTVTRVFGDSRYDTSVEVAKTFCKDVDMAVVASGKNFPDGLCGGPLAAALDAPLVLTKDGGAGAASGYVAENGIASGYVLGGDGALADDTVVDVFALESADDIKDGNAAKEDFVGVFWFTFTDSYLSSIKTTLDAEFEALGLEEEKNFKHYDAGRNQDTQMAQIDSAIQNGATCLAVNIVEAGSQDVSQQIIDKASAAGIPVVFFNRIIEMDDVEESVLESYDKCAYVGANAPDAGHVQGEMIGEYLVENYDAVDLNGDGKISYAMFMGQLENPDAVYRTRYSVESANTALEKAGKPELVYFDSANEDGYQVDQEEPWSPDAANRFMNANLVKYNEDNDNMIELVICNNDGMAEGVISALVSFGYNTEGSTIIPVFGIDGTERAKELIEQRTMSGTVEHDAEGVAICLADLVGNVKSGKKLMDGTEDYNIAEGFTNKIFIPYVTYTAK